MGINVTALRDKLIWGGARPTLFFCTVYFPTNVVNSLSPYLQSAPAALSKGVNSTEISFYMKAASIPESTVAEVTKSFLGRDIKIPSIDRTFGPWTVTIINDEDYRVRHLFEAWIEYVSPGAAIFENQSGFGPEATNHVFGQMQVHQLQKDGGISTLTGEKDGPYFGSYYFVDAFPTNVSEIALSWDDKDTIEEFTVTFAYQYWKKNTPELGLDNNVTINPFTANESDEANASMGVKNEDAWITRSAIS